MFPDAWLGFGKEQSSRQTWAALSKPKRATTWGVTKREKVWGEEADYEEKEEDEGGEGREGEGTEAEENEEEEEEEEEEVEEEEEEETEVRDFSPQFVTNEGKGKRKDVNERKEQKLWDGRWYNFLDIVTDQPKELLT